MPFNRSSYSGLRPRSSSTPESASRSYGHRPRVTADAEAITARLFAGALDATPASIPTTACAAPAGMWHRHTLEEVQATTEGHTWLVAPGIVCQGFLTLLGGQSGSGKSSFAMYCAEAVARGHDYSATLWVDIEDRLRMLSREDTRHSKCVACLFCSTVVPAGS